MTDVNNRERLRSLMYVFLLPGGATVARQHPRSHKNAPSHYVFLLHDVLIAHKREEASGKSGID